MTPTTLTGHAAPARPDPAIRRIGMGEIGRALGAGWRDFLARPSHVVFLFVVFPAAGFVLSYLAFDYALMPLIFPLLAGFALIGPVSAVGVFELSRRREAGGPVALDDALAVRRRPGWGGILRVALVLLGLFTVWIVTAQQIVFATIGEEAPAGIGAFLAHVTSTEAGREMFVIGNAVGFVFAVVALVLSVFSLPMLVDGETSARRAMATSVRACLANPVTMGAWGLTVAVLLALAMLPALAGLLVVLPWLGHATWHLYRAAIAPMG